ncbi:endonuclease III domain protein [Agrilactobacillus composti DSM 18527 = JCM 14202]|nr:hypothetical protein [Agrilactobacillus composti]GAF40950.1 endonuclease III domain protein [Agrilactobacillus composti DSM 18527 = JCM 14202]
MKQLTINTLFALLAENMPATTWPADSKLEIALDAILVQNTTWQNILPSIANLKKTTGINGPNILALPQADLATLIRPSGFYQNKSRAIINFLTWFKNYDFDLTQAKNNPAAQLRQALLALRGIGPETADVILLYVLDKPQFIADSYARRLFAQLGVASAAKYNTLKQVVEKTQPQLTLTQWQDFHGHIDDFGKQYLRRYQNFSASFLAGYTLDLA